MLLACIATCQEKMAVQALYDGFVQICILFHE